MKLITSKTINKISVLSILFGLMISFCSQTVAQTKKKTKSLIVKEIIPKKIIPKKIIKKEAVIVENIEIDQPVYPNPNPADYVEKNSGDYIQSAAGVGIVPTYIGGIEAFFKFVGDNYNVPKEKGLKGKIFIQFVVETDGSLTDVKCLRDIGYGTGYEAIRVVKTSPKWTPAVNDGKPVRCTYQLPISIESPE